MKEYREVLCRKKFKFELPMIKYILSAIEKYGIFVVPNSTGIILSDMKDLPFYEAAVRKQDEHVYLVTGNIKHFPKETFVVIPRQLMDILEEK